MKRILSYFVILLLGATGVIAQELHIFDNETRVISEDIETPDMVKLFMLGKNSTLILERDFTITAQAIIAKENAKIIADGVPITTNVPNGGRGHDAGPGHPGGGGGNAANGIKGNDGYNIDITIVSTLKSDPNTSLIISASGGNGQDGGNGGDGGHGGRADCGRVEEGKNGGNGGNGGSGGNGGNGGNINITWQSKNNISSASTDEQKNGLVTLSSIAPDMGIIAISKGGIGGNGGTGGNGGSGGSGRRCPFFKLGGGSSGSAGSNGTAGHDGNNGVIKIGAGSNN